MMQDVFTGKRVLITGGTGSLGSVLVKTLLHGIYGTPKQIIVFSRDEAKQHFMRVTYSTFKKPTDEIIYDNFRRLLTFRIGDVRSYASICRVLREADIVINAAALKQVPSCEYFVHEACETNIMGASNIVRAIEENALPVETVVGVTTDKACLPVNAMGMTKALQERLFIAANLSSPNTRYICARYGNVLASRGSVVPLFHEQILAGGPVTITATEMTRFLLPLSHAVTTIATAIARAYPGETWIPKIPAVRILHLAEVLIGRRDIQIVTTGIRPGEKLHELMISPEEGLRTFDRDDFYAIAPMLPELEKEEIEPPLGTAYGSNDFVMNKEETADLLKEHHLLLDYNQSMSGEMLA